MYMCNISDSHLHHINRKLNASVSIAIEWRRRQHHFFFLLAYERADTVFASLNTMVDDIISFGVPRAFWPTGFSSHGNNLSALIYVDENFLFFFTWLDCHPFYRRFDMSRFIHKFYLVISTHLPFYFYVPLFLCVCVEKSALSPEH